MAGLRLKAMVRFGVLSLMAAVCLQAQWRVMPMPAKIAPASGGRLPIRQDFRIGLEGYREARLDAANQRAMDRLSKITGMALRSFVVGQMPKAVLSIQTAGASKPVQEFGEDESYKLNVSAAGAALTAPKPLGVLRGIETFLQLVENDATAGWSVPAVAIEDAPRFPWRGLHMDVARHFMPIEVVKRNLDAMAAVKLNVYHWHLSDDQGFRVESKRFPKLQELGSDGLFYTQEQIRDVVAYAHDRGIRVVPEFDVPGHATSWLVGYPELASAPGPYQIIRTWGVFDPAMDPANPAVYKFLDTFIGEMSALFPDSYFHIGGDEVNGKQWRLNTTDIPGFMKQQGFTGNHQLQAYFNQQLQKIVTKHGKRMEGWDEILNDALPRDIVIQSWRGLKSLAEGSRQGFQGILSSPYYLDHIDPASRMYLADPLAEPAASLTPEQKKRILGGEVCMWAEYVSPETVDSRIWPRTAAIAERFWSPENVRDIDDMYRRLAFTSVYLDFAGVKHNANYLPMLERLAGTTQIEPLKTLADVVEPGDLGLRHRMNRNYTQSTPLNRFVDAARPDSQTAREFGGLVDRHLARAATPVDEEALRMWLTRWSKNDELLRPIISKRDILREIAPLSANLARIAQAALQALDTPAAKKPISNLPDLKAIRQPVAEVHLAVADSLAKLLQ